MRNRTLLDTAIDQALLKVEFQDLGPHNGMGEMDPDGSYTAFELSEIGDHGDMPMRKVFMSPTHQMFFFSGWQDIRDAPHDGTDILTWDGNNQEVLFWSKYGNGWTCGDPKVKHIPTHWMPLPEIPTDLKEKHDGHS